MNSSIIFEICDLNEQMLCLKGIVVVSNASNSAFETYPKFTEIRCGFNIP